MGLQKLLYTLFRGGYCALTLGISFAFLISAPSYALPEKSQPLPPPAWQTEQEAAVLVARHGDTDKALTILSKLHREHPEQMAITRDLLAVSGWAGRDDAVITLYKELPADEPDYVLEAVGHAYRDLKDPEKALFIYHSGLQRSPDNLSYAIGAVRCLNELGRPEEAVHEGSIYVSQHRNSLELVTVFNDAWHAYAIQLARAGHYPEALKRLGALHEIYPQDIKLTYDYLLVSSWAGNNKDVVNIYKALPQEEAPDYVLDAVGRSYRNLHQPDKASILYREALQRYPDKENFALGEILSLMEANRVDDALRRIYSALQKHPQDKKPFIAILKNASQRKAILLARQGYKEEALNILQKLRAQYPSDSAIASDYLTVLSWTGRDPDVIRQYEASKALRLSDYALIATGHSYRDKKQATEALQSYRDALKLSPDSEAAIVGVIRSLIDSGNYEEAQKTAESDLQQHGPRAEVLLAAANAAEKNKKIYEELTYAERAQELSPGNPDALRALIYAEDHIGAPQLALALADAHPGILSEKAHRQMEGDGTAALVRWGTLEPLSEAERYMQTDRAIALLNAQIVRWSRLGSVATPEVTRARFDRIIALGDRSRMRDVVAEYERMKAESITPPAYVLSVVGGAYLYLRKPEEARNIYLEVLHQNPHDFESQRQLFFAYVECGDFKRAYALIDALDKQQPVWLYQKGEPERLENPNRAMVDRDVGKARLYGGELAIADQQLSAITRAAPFDALNRSALGSVYLSRGWPRQALEQFDIGTNIQEGKSAENEVGQALAYLDMRDYPQADTRMRNLQQRFPESLEVTQAERLWQVNNMAELVTSAFYNFRPSNSAQGGDGYGVDAEIYSAPIDYNWRVFAAEGFRHEEEPAQEGKINYSRSMVGVEYRDTNIVASIAPTYNNYTTGLTNTSAQRGGLAVAADWTFNDQWSAGGGYELFSYDVPLRALNSGVSADKYSANIEWRESESRELRLDAEVMPFSDDNLRTASTLTYSERLYTTPYFKLDALGDVSTTQDSENTGQEYFNPSLDFKGLAGLRATQTLYHFYDTLYEHSLMLMPAGSYWQQNYGNSYACNARYEQDYHSNNTFKAGFITDYTRQDYNGKSENNYSILLNATGRF